MRRIERGRLSPPGVRATPELPGWEAGTLFDLH
jgi:hypothetical protein